jgi:hypothetical protein
MGVRAVAEPMEREGNRAMSDATSIAAMSVLEQAGICYKRLDDDNMEVAGKFILYVQSGFWRAQPGDRRGYTVRELITEIKGATVGDRGIVELDLRCGV